MMQVKLVVCGFDIEECFWLNLVDSVWLVYVCNCVCYLMFINGKGVIKLVVYVSVLGEYFEWLFCNYFWNYYYFGDIVVNCEFVYYLCECWFLVMDIVWLVELLILELQVFYNLEGSILVEMLVDMNLGNLECGICVIFYICQGDGVEVFFLVNIISNFYVSNGMLVGNMQVEVCVQVLLEIFECYVKFKVIVEGICLFDVLEEVIVCYLGIVVGIVGLCVVGFGILVKDVLFGGQYLVMCVIMLNLYD